jgi:lipopolysaccharide cholinephosphotransferase
MAQTPTSKVEIKLDELKSIQINILKAIDSFCKQNNIKYFLAYGTLLGSVRHKGYIPWDDDIDIIMSRSDYEVFLKKFNLSSIRYKFICNQNFDEYYLVFGKAIDTQTVLIENGVINASHIGIYVDIFPYDNRYDSYSCSLLLSYLIKFINFIRLTKPLSFNHKTKTITRQLIFYIFKLITAPFSLKKLNNIVESLSKISNQNNSKYVSVAPGSIIYERAWFNDCIEEKFEGIYFQIPREYDKVLTAMFGNYMQLPSVEKRVSHHYFIAYWK